jgi:hypothetical protein
VSDDTHRDSSSRTKRRARLRLGAVLAVAVAIAFVVWLVVGDSGEDEGAETTTAAAQATPARAATQEEIRALAGSLDYPIYWAGPLPNRTYELTRTASGRVYIRYLPRTVDVGDPSPRHLTISTYPQANGYAAVQAAARQPDTVSRRTAGGALIVWDRGRPSSVYFSFPRARFQVEVFHPSPRRARSLTYSGRIQRVR